MSIISDLEDALAGACDELHEDAVRRALGLVAERDIAEEHTWDGGHGSGPVRALRSSSR